MTQYSTLNMKLSNLQLNKLRIGIENGTEVTLKNASIIVGDSNDDNNFSYKLLLTNGQVSKLHEAFANNSSANIKFGSKNSVASNRTIRRIFRETFRIITKKWYTFNRKST